MKKKILKGILLMSSLALVGCGNGNSSSTLEKDDTPDKGLEVVGENIKFDPNKLVNDGEVIELEWWLWDAPDIFQEVADDYMEIYPNVSIEVVSQPWDDMWTNLPLALDGGRGPAIFNIHNSQHYNLIDYIEPYDIDVEDITKDYLNSEAHIIDDEIYYIDYGMMTGAMYYNKEHWEEAGLTKDDYPQTWDELIDIAQLLTIEKDGKIERAGLNLNDQHRFLLLALGYQKGEYLFDENNTTALIDTEVKADALKDMLDFYDEYNVGDKDFGSESQESFGQGMSSITYNWGHYNGQLNNEYPDIDFGVFELPSYKDDNQLAYDRYNGETTPAINNNLEEGEMEVAQDFIRFYLTNEDFQRKLSLNYSVFPTYFSLQEDEEILAHPVLSAIADTIDERIWPGPMPATVEDTLEAAIEDVLYNNISIEDALKDADQKINESISKSEFKARERLQD